MENLPEIHGRKACGRAEAVIPEIAVGDLQKLNLHQDLRPPREQLLQESLRGQGARDPVPDHNLALSGVQSELVNVRSLFNCLADFGQLLRRQCLGHRDRDLDRLLEVVSFLRRVLGNHQHPRR